jgi:Stage II sporulation protein E (SpoIIE)
MSDRFEFLRLVRAMRGANPADVPELMLSAAAELGGVDVVVYLVDFEQAVLEPVPDRSTHDEVPQTEAVGTTIAGRVFLQQRAATTDRGSGTRVWVPIVEGSDPTGVLALTVPTLGDDTVVLCEALGALAGYLIATEARVTDLYNLYRRRKAMNLAATMQWDLLPPLSLASPDVTVAGMVEPAYEVGGDCFDYALNGSVLDIALMDSMGHGIRSAMVAALAVGCYRHQRREGQPLEQLHRNLDGVIAEHSHGAFVSGIIGRLDLNTGILTLLNAGHPPPLLVRHGQVIDSMDAPTVTAWGLRLGEPETATTNLEPGDSVVLYTDGVIDARGSPHHDFGTERLSDLVGRYASDQLPIGLIVRLITRAVLEHHQGRLYDDATVLMLHWIGSD